MPICRNLIHESKTPEFKKFLEGKGWTIRKPTNCFEKIRATKTGEPTIVLYQRSTTAHLTFGWNQEHAYKLALEFIRSKNK
jgi:hypothetical protein